MRVLLIGSGGREHALAWAIAKSPELSELVAAPGNPGIAKLARLAPIPVSDGDRLVELAAYERFDLVVVGPEAPLADGLADRLQEAGIPCLGPRRDAARLEASKSFAKDFLERRGIPTARHRVIRETTEARRVLKSRELGEQVVVKASGLAAGKGVFLPDSLEEAEQQAERLLAGALGEAGHSVVLEERLEGPELSVFAISDGENVAFAGTARDFKRRFDGDRGPNTGGMGCVSPGNEDPELLAHIRRDILEPTITGLAEEGRAYRGILYAGLMLTANGPRVLEFNVRFGDPEAQAVLPRLDSDLLPVLHAAATGRLTEQALRFRPEPSVCVILVSDGYPGEYRKGELIHGLPESVESGEARVFHAGTRIGTHKGPDGIRTAGGRVVAVTGLGSDRESARRTAYRTADGIHWDGLSRREDIGA